MSDEMLTVVDAALIAERDPVTIRRWVKRGKLSRHEGPVPSTGGAVPLRIDRMELLALLAGSGQKPREDEPEHESAQANTAPPVSPNTSVHELFELQLELVRMRGELQVERVQRESAELQAERLREQLEEAKRDHAQLRYEAREDLEVERGRVQALEAELRALRASHGTSWWRALLPGPAAPALGDT